MAGYSTDSPTTGEHSALAPPAWPLRPAIPGSHIKPSRRMLKSWIGPSRYAAPQVEAPRPTRRTHRRLRQRSRRTPNMASTVRAMIAASLQNEICSA
jgi:hypothetical protein